MTEIIRPRTLAHPKLSGSTKKTVNIILTDFANQMSDLLSVKDYKEAFYIITNALDKIAYLQNAYLISDKSLEALRLTFLNGLELVLKENLAPIFRKKAEDQLISNVKKSYYFPKSNSLLTMLDDYNVLAESDKRSLLDDLIAKQADDKDNQFLIINMIQLTVPLPELTNKLLSSINHEQIFKGLSELVALRKFPIVDFYLNNEAVVYDLHKTAIGCMLQNQQEDYPALTKTLVQINTENTPLFILKDVIDHLSTAYFKQEFEKLREWMVALPFGLRCSILAKIQYFEELGAALREHSQVEWLKVYDVMLIDWGYRDLVKELYLHCAMTYLENHLGTRAVEYMARINHRLNGISEHKMLTDIQERLYDKFSDRINIQ